MRTLRRCTYVLHTTMTRYVHVVTMYVWYAKTQTVASCRVLHNTLTYVTGN